LKLQEAHQRRTARAARGFLQEGGGGCVTGGGSAIAAGVLDKLRAGLPDIRAEAGGVAYVPTVVDVFSVPSNCFLSHEQIEAIRQGGTIVDAGQCQPLAIEHEAASALPAPGSREGEVVDFPASRRRPPIDDPQSREALEARLAAMPYKTLLALAGIDDDEPDPAA